ncbi:MAG: hypothetical protein WC718_01040 [Phycisphaerales bacterium]|jgi:hypothetical protein
MDRRTFMAHAAWAGAMLSGFGRGASALGQPAAPAGFVPSKHGFGFVNHFEGVPLPREIREGKTLVTRLLRQAAKGTSLPTTFGLCGGMSLAAADYYHAKQPPPPDTTPPKQGTPLYEYLHQRQTDSLGENLIMATKFIEWMMLPDTGDGSCAARTKPELADIVARLRQGEVVPLGLVLVRADGNNRSRAAAGAAWQNHQVLAYAAKEGEAVPEGIRVYDPNYPRDDGVMVVTNQAKPGPDGTQFELRHSRGSHAVRGCFPMPYRPAPPWKPQ